MNVKEFFYHFYLKIKKKRYNFVSIINPSRKLFMFLNFLNQLNDFSENISFIFVSEESVKFFQWLIFQKLSQIYFLGESVIQIKKIYCPLPFYFVNFKISSITFSLQFLNFSLFYDKSNKWTYWIKVSCLNSILEIKDFVE